MTHENHNQHKLSPDMSRSHADGVRFLTLPGSVSGCCRWFPPPPPSSHADTHHNTRGVRWGCVQYLQVFGSPSSQSIQRRCRAPESQLWGQLASQCRPQKDFCPAAVQRPHSPAGSRRVTVITRITPESFFWLHWGGEALGEHKPPKPSSWAF